MKQSYAKQIWTVPNILSYLRIILIPVFAAAYLNDRLWLSVAALALSALSDVADGFIARKLNQVTDLGKILDPIADKLTQATVIICISTVYRPVIILFFLLLVKEPLMLLMGMKTLRNIGQVHGARWYGKVCTAVLYGSMAIFVLVPSIPHPLVNLLVALCSGVIVMALVMYVLWYRKLRAGYAAASGEEMSV